MRFLKSVTPPMESGQSVPPSPRSGSPAHKTKKDWLVVHIPSQTPEWHPPTRRRVTPGCRKTKLGKFAAEYLYYFNEFLYIFCLYQMRQTEAGQFSRDF